MSSDEEEWDTGNAVDGRRGANADANEEVHQSDAIDSQHTESSAPANCAPFRKTKPRKRGRLAAAHDDDDDFESQPTITKWFRHVPGPLQDVMKQQQIDLQQSMDDDGIVASGRSSGHAVHISTVFDDGPWVDMCEYLQMPTQPGELYGGVKMGSLKHTVSHILDDDLSTPKVPRLLVLIKSMRYVDEEITAVFHDPTGEVEGYFHRDIVEQVGPGLVAGTAVALRQVSVFTPTDAAVGGASKRYLNVIPRNMIGVFPPESVSATLESIVRSYNEAQAQLIKTEEETVPDTVTESQHQDVERDVFAHADVRTTTTELSFISQRQVVQRHQPVRSGNSVTDDDGTEADTSSKSKKQKKTTAKEPPTGLGRWQWHQLAQKKPVASNDDDEDKRPSEPRRTFMSGRFTELLSQHLQAKRAATTAVGVRPTQLITTGVASAPASRRESTGSTPSKSVRFATSATDDDEDVDDDW